MTPTWRFERKVPIRFSHCDPAGIVFFPQYFVLFNALVEDWFTEGLGVNYAVLVGQRRVGVPTIALQSEFTRPSRMGEEVTFGLSVQRIGNSSFRVALGCRHGAELRVRAQQVLATTSLETDRAIPIPRDVRSAMDAFLTEDTEPLPFDRGPGGKGR
jgi:4-hydroxybenzoyl-CoA thioesterase